VGHILYLLLSFLIIPMNSLASDGLHKLTVSDNGRYLVSKISGAPVFLMGDTCWVAHIRGYRSEIDDYLIDRKKKNFNIIGVIALHTTDFNSGKNVYGNRPFEIGQDDNWDLTRTITTSGSDPEDAEQYGYWDHLDYFIGQIINKGFYVYLWPTIGDHIAGSWNGKDTSKIIFNRHSAYQYGHWLGTRYKGYKDYIIWALGGDRAAVIEGRNYASVYRAMAEGIADGVNAVYEHNNNADYSTALMTYHSRKGKPQSSAWFHNEAWLDLNSVQAFLVDQPSDIVKDWNKSPSKPTWLAEGRYECSGDKCGRKKFGPWNVRYQAYQTVFGGGFGTMYGHYEVMRFNLHPHKGYLWKESLDAEGGMTMQYLDSLISSLNKEEYLNRIPDQSLIIGNQGSSSDSDSDIIQATRDIGATYALIYSANGRDIHVKMNILSGPSTNSFWFNPRNGRWHVNGSEYDTPKPFLTEIRSGAGATSRIFTPPGSPGRNNDWVLMLKGVTSPVA